MPVFAILTNRKRALIALIHAGAFWGLAVRDFAVSSRLGGILGASTGMGRSTAFFVVYLIVTIVLGYLFVVSKCANEQLYFALCTASAGTGLLRAMVGDSAFPAGQYLRMGLLACAVLAGFVILRRHSPHPMAIGNSCAPEAENADL